jgi:hypothetical protein
MQLCCDVCWMVWCVGAKAEVKSAHSLPNLSATSKRTAQSENRQRGNDGPPMRIKGCGCTHVVVQSMMFDESKPEYGCINLGRYCENSTTIFLYTADYCELALCVAFWRKLFDVRCLRKVEYDRSPFIAYTT